MKDARTVYGGAMFRMAEESRRRSMSSHAVVIRMRQLIIGAPMIMRLWRSASLPAASTEPRCRMSAFAGTGAGISGGGMVSRQDPVGIAFTMPTLHAPARAVRARSENTPRRP